MGIGGQGGRLHPATGERSEMLLGGGAGAQCGEGSESTEAHDKRTESDNLADLLIYVFP